MNSRSVCAWRAVVVFLAALAGSAPCAAQSHKAGDVILEAATLTASDGKPVAYELGTLFVPENRSDPKSRVIAVGFVRVKASKRTGAPPTFHLPGGPGNSILGALRAGGRTAGRFLQYRAIGDVILMDQRGYSEQGERLVYRAKFPASLDQASSADARNAAVVAMARAAVGESAAKGIDLSGYTVVECAHDVDDLRRALGYRKITLVGQSFGSQWSFAVMRLHPQIVERALLSGVEPLNNGYDMPSHVFAALQRIAFDADRDPRLQPYLPDGGSMGAVQEIMRRLRAAPVSIQLKSPVTNQTDTVVLGVGDFQQLLAQSGARWPADILAIYRGDYTAWAERVRSERRSMAMGREMKLIGWLIDSSLGVTALRAHQLYTDPASELLGHWSFDPFIASAETWPSRDVGDDFRTPVLTQTPVLFINGDWDTSTPIENLLDVLPYFPNSHALIVHRGEHSARGRLEMTRPDVMSKVLEFLKSGRAEQLPMTVEYPPPEFEVREPSRE